MGFHPSSSPSLTLQNDSFPGVPREPRGRAVTWRFQHSRGGMDPNSDGKSSDILDVPIKTPFRNTYEYIIVTYKYTILLSYDNMAIIHFLV